MNAMSTNRYFFAVLSAVLVFMVMCIDLTSGESSYCDRPRDYEGLGVTVACYEDFVPYNCDFNEIPLLTVEDFDRCGPARLNQSARNYFLGAAGRRITYLANKAAYKKIRIVPNILRDVSKFTTEVRTLGQRVAFPIGFSPVASQNLANPLGEIATARAVSNMGTVMILSSYASTRLEDVAKAVNGGSHLWMQTYIFKNRSYTEQLVARAEKAGFEAIVATIDSPVSGTLTCSARSGLLGAEIINIPGEEDREEIIDSSLTFKDLSWLVSITKLPIVAKGVLSADAARQAVRAGASAILVSNHGGRQLDSDPPTIDVLPSIVDAVKRRDRPVDVYVDGGVRNGWDVYKALANGAKMVFVGRPIIYGLAIGGEDGVRQVLEILRTEFEETMRLAGFATPRISRDTLIQCGTRC